MVYSKEENKEYHRKWYLENIEKQKEEHRLYRLNNVEKERERHALYRSKNKHKQKQYYLDNIETFLAKRKEYREVNKEKCNKENKIYCETHKEQIFLRRRQYREDNAEAIRIKKYDRHRGSKTDLVLNNWFPESNLHHIEEGVGIYVPVDLHLSVHHVLKSGEGMWRINRKVFEWVVSTGQKVLIPVKTA